MAECMELFMTDHDVVMHDMHVDFRKFIFQKHDGLVKITGSIHLSFILLRIVISHGLINSSISS